MTKQPKVVKKCVESLIQLRHRKRRKPPIALDLSWQRSKILQPIAIRMRLTKIKISLGRRSVIAPG